MKHLSILLFLALSIGVKAAVPTDAELAKYYSSGQVCVCIQFLDSVCNDMVWCGSYNDWQTNLSTMAYLQPVAGYKGWYVVAFKDDSDNICGKVVQLKSDGSFDWQYQTGDADSWAIVRGSATIDENQWGEGELRQIDKTSPLVAISSEWKNQLCVITPPPSSTAYSGTLPVLFINTEGSTPITSKDEYLKATYYLDNLGLSGYKSIASKTQPDTMQIKGRGNWTWSGFDKKPYRLKLSNKQAMMGMKKSKHWTLLAHADDQFCWMKNTIGFYMSEQLGLKWTPKQAPVEVVLNGDYIGLYMLTEQIRVDKDRVNIVEQEDECTNQDSITGGWLVEIDNYEEPYRIEFYEPSNKWHGWQTVWVTPKTPEVLSKQQSNYLQNQMEAINDAIYGTNETALTNLMDMNEAARFYLVQELMSDCESYHGSCYLYKNANENVNENQKWYFGPVWDFGNSFRDKNKFIYDDPTFSQIWIGQLAEHSSFNAARLKAWQHWKYYDYAQIEAVADSFAILIEDAAEADAKRWPQYNHSDVQKGKNNFLDMYDRHVQWLTQQWGEGKQDEPTELEMQNSQCTMHNEKVLINGQLYIVRDGCTYTIEGLRIEE